MLFTISLILFVSISLLVTWNDMCSHDIPPHKQGRKLNVLKKIKFSAYETETSQESCPRSLSFVYTICS